MYQSCLLNGDGGCNRHFFSADFFNFKNKLPLSSLIYLVLRLDEKFMDVFRTFHLLWDFYVTKCIICYIFFYFRNKMALTNGIYIVQGEIALLITAMRRTSRYGAHGRHIRQVSCGMKRQKGVFDRVMNFLFSCLYFLLIEKLFSSVRVKNSRA